MHLNLLDILKKQITEQGGKFKDMVDLQGKTAGEYYVSAVIGDDMTVTDVLSQGESESYSDFSDVDIESYGWPTGVYPTCIDGNVICPGGTNGTWDGSLPLVLKIAKLSDLTPGSQKRSTKLSASGNISNHWCGLPYQYAADLPVSGSKGDEQFLKIKQALLNLGWLSDTDPDYLSWEKNVGNYPYFKYNGFKCQVLWKSDSDHYDHIHVGCRNLSPKNPIESKDCLYYNVDLGVKSKIVDPKKENITSEGKTITKSTYIIQLGDPSSEKFNIVWGGTPSTSYGANFMKVQGDSYLSNKNIIYSDWENGVSTLKEKLKKELGDGYSIRSVSGFSKGGEKTWNEINSGYEFVGLIDPSTSYARTSLPANVKMMSNHSNWSYYPNMMKALKKMEEFGLSERIGDNKTYNHDNIPKKFFEQYSGNY